MTLDVKTDLAVGMVCLAALIAVVITFPTWTWLWMLMLVLLVSNVASAIRLQHKQIEELRQALEQHRSENMRFGAQAGGRHPGMPRTPFTPSHKSGPGTQ